ncbi:unnamed protein product [Rhizophagus irregularis]|nr:unnamed protein product [Rhizophagus irregularis]
MREIQNHMIINQLYVVDTECLDVTPQTKGLQAFPQLFPSEMESTLKLFKNKQPTVNPFISLDKTNDPHSFTTPQKRQFKDEQAQQYVNNLPLICAFDLSIEQLKLVIGTEIQDLAQQTMSIRSQNPSIWTLAIVNTLTTRLIKSGVISKQRSRILSPMMIMMNLSDFIAEKS